MTTTTSLSWRAAHAWLRGYSDGKIGRTLEVFPEGWEPYREHYTRGHDLGAGATTEPAYLPAEREQCQV